MSIMKLVELTTFKKQHESNFVDWNKSAIKADGVWYKLKNINVGGKNYPYVSIPDIELPKPKPLILSKDIMDKVKEVNKKEIKPKLKRISYIIDNDEYFVTGIGKKSIQAIKNDSTKEKYYWYNTREGKKLLNHIYGKIGQATL